jgi:heat shock protein HtpX
MNSIFKTTILLGALTGLLMVIGGLAGGRHGVQIALIFAIAMNFFSYWFSDKMVLAAYGAFSPSCRSSRSRRTSRCRGSI